MVSLFRVACALGACCVMFLCSSCAEEEATGAPVRSVPYLCRESGELLLAPEGPTPAVHPQTGQATLLRALYCERCGKWLPVPPADVYRGNPLSYQCPDHEAALSSTGPGLPE